MARVLLSISDKFLETVDELAEKEGRTRSELVREALRQYIQRDKLDNGKAFISP